jgi:hypothetical protein
MPALRVPGDRPGTVVIEGADRPELRHTSPVGTSAGAVLMPWGRRSP